jgi:hypothetical protein
MTLASVFRKDLSGHKDYVKSFVEHLNPNDNGGEAVILSVDVYDNGDDEDSVYTNITLEINCYGTSSSTIQLNTVRLEDLAASCNSIMDSIKTLRK